MYSFSVLLVFNVLYQFAPAIVDSGYPECEIPGRSVYIVRAITHVRADDTLVVVLQSEDKFLFLVLTGVGIAVV
jgi:hypothetical protein